MTLGIAFVGGGNMAGALVGGLVQAGRSPASIVVVEPNEAARSALAARFGVGVRPAADAALASADVVVWAVKPQAFRDAAVPAAAHVRNALHVSVMAGIRSDAIARATGSARIVRAMPNTPALIGRGIAGVCARPAASASDRAIASELLAPTGELVWFDDEASLDAVTALSGSGPAYVFLLVEALADAGVAVGLSADAARRLALQTVAGSGALAAQSDDAPAELRRKVTSPGGTTEAALAVLESRGLRGTIADAVRAARDRARALGDASLHT